MTGGGGIDVLFSAEIYDPAGNGGVGSWSATGSLAAARYSHTATLLANGKVLVAGGSGGGANLTSSELYDPAGNGGAGAWSTTGSLATGRVYHTATLLVSGRVLVTGGLGNSGYLSSAELYNPVGNGGMGTWSAAGSLATERVLNTATHLPNGTLLVAGGFANSGFAQQSAEIYNIGLSNSSAWQPAITAASFNASNQLVLTGTGFIGISSASGGNGTQDSSSNYPIVQLRRLDNEQTTFQLSDSTTNTSATAFTSMPVIPFSGYAMATVFTNGIPGVSSLVAFPLPATSPTVTTATWASLTSATATLGGNVTSDGNAAITARGVVYAPSASNNNPQLGGTGVVNVTDTGTTGVFAVNVTGLTPNTAYTYAAYATNSVGTSYSGTGTFTTLSPADIAVEQPAGTGIASGGTQTFVTPCDTPQSLTFTIRNPAAAGADSLTGLTITMDGTNAADFSVTANPTAPVAPAETTTLTVRFSPAPGSATTLYETAAIHIANNVAAKNPYLINLSGTALSYTQSTNNDGMSDAAKFRLAPLGFNWQTNQPVLVNTYYAAANAANLYSLSQVQTLNVNTPLLTKDPATGKFKLTLALKKTTNLGQPFTDFPMNASGASAIINDQGQLEFQFSMPDDNAAFFRLQSQ